MAPNITSSPESSSVLSLSRSLTLFLVVRVDDISRARKRVGVCARKIISSKHLEVVEDLNNRISVEHNIARDPALAPTHLGILLRHPIIHGHVCSSFNCICVHFAVESEPEMADVHYASWRCHNGDRTGPQAQTIQSVSSAEGYMWLLLKLMHTRGLTAIDTQPCCIYLISATLHT